MKLGQWTFFAAMLLAGAGCLSAATRRTIASAEAEAASYAAPEPPRAGGERATGGAPPRADAALAGSVDLATLVEAALARSPMLAEGAARVRASAARARAEGKLPPPEVMFELSAVPLERPYAIPDADMLVLGLRQELPAPGSLDRAAYAMSLEARADAAMLAGQARALVREVARAFAEYAEAHARHLAHVEHVALVQQTAEAARARYAAGGPLSDVTKADLERARMEVDVVLEAARIREAHARLNGLLQRPPDAPLGPPRVPPPVTVRASAKAAAYDALGRTPEVVAAELRRAAARSSADAADVEDSVPSFMVALSYFHPVGDMHAGWGASVGMSLPWLWGGARDRTDAAEQRVHAEQAAARGARSRARTEIGTALAALEGAERRLLLLRDVARPAARRSLDAATAGYAGGGTDFLMWLDAKRMSLDVELSLGMARADLDRALADLDWAAGMRMPRMPLGSAEDAR